MGLFNPMGPKQMNMPKSSAEKIAEAPEMKFIREQLKEATDIEDYEQAAVLRDVISAGEQKGTAFEFKMNDFMAPDKNGACNYNEEDPKHRAWQGVNERLQADYFSGKEIVDESEFSDNLTTAGSFISPLYEEEWEEIKRLKNIGGAKKIDYALDLRDKLQEMCDIVNLAKERLEHIWRPLCEKNGWFGPEYQEFCSNYNDNCGWSNKRDAKVLSHIPLDIDDPLRYWQMVYDNARFTAKELNKALKELE